MSMHRQQLHRVMSLAWALWRNARLEGERRPFGDCLTGAWKMHKGAARVADAIRGATRIDFSPSLIRSPIARATNSALLDFNAAYTTAKLGR